MAYKFDDEIYNTKEELLEVLDLTPYDGVVFGNCPVCGEYLDEIATYRLKNGQFLCAELECVLEYFWVEEVDEEYEDDYEERMREYNKERL